MLSLRAIWGLGCAVLLALGSGCSSKGTPGGDGGSGADGGGGTSAPCGDGVIGPGEDCDGSALNGASCSSLGFDSGTLTCAASCRFDASACTGSLPPTVTTSRSSCAAPCGVFFDATTTQGLMNGDYVNADFNWDFDSTAVDPTGVHAQTIGFVVAHVFDKPGTYQVTLRLRDTAGHAGSTTIPITVSAMTGSTIYVAMGGSDGDPGDMDHPVATFAHALTIATPPASILLHRGDTFNLGSSTVMLNQTGPLLIGAYGSATANPILSSTVTTAGPMFTVSGSDLRLTDLHLTAASHAAGAVYMGGAANTLFERLEIDGVASAETPGENFYVDKDSHYTFLVDENLHDFFGYGLFGNITNQLAVIGTTIANFSGGTEGLRIQGGTVAGGTSGQYAMDTYVADTHVTFDDDGTSFESLTFRGDDKNVVCIGSSGNHYMSFAPQDPSSQMGGDEHISYVLAEGNTVAYGTPYPLGIVVTAQHVAVRNNRIVNGFGAVEVIGEGAAGPLPLNWVDDVKVYNNTHYMFPAAGSVEEGYSFTSILHTGTTGSILVEDNLISEGGMDPGSALFASDHMSTTETVDHNLIFAPNASGGLDAPGVGSGGVTGDPKFVSIDLTNPSAFQLSMGSAAIDVGAKTAAYQDFAGVLRPAGVGWDIGAFEYTP